MSLRLVGWDTAVIVTPDPDRPCSLSYRLQTPLPALFPPPTLAASAILLSTHQSSPPVALPDGWWDLFDVEYDDMVCVCGWILRLYERIDSGEGRRAWKMEGKAEVRAWLAEQQPETS